MKNAASSLEKEDDATSVSSNHAVASAKDREVVVVPFCFRLYLFANCFLSIESRKIAGMLQRYEEIRLESFFYVILNLKIKHGMK